MPKPKLALYWCASCGGCEETVVDLGEDLLGLVEKVDIVLWPVAMDYKYADVRGMADGSIHATLLNGSIRSTEQEEMARLLRRKSQYLIAYGSCAVTGGIPSLANQFPLERVLEYVYQDSPSTVNDSRVRPQVRYDDCGREVVLPELWNVVRSLDQVVEVDYYIPGCPPTPDLTRRAIGLLLEGDLPPKGSVLAPDQALCGECPRRDSKPADVAFTRFRRPHELLLDPKTCFLAQGVVCMGPATRAGCGSQCPAGNMPCTGCFGGTSRVRDQGAKILSSLCANLSAKDEAGIEASLRGIVDPVGTFYRYGLARSLLRRRVDLPTRTKTPAVEA